MIKFEDVSFSYPAFEIQDLNFEIGEGEIIAVTGNNASGKTTILNLMAGLLKQKKGKITINGERPVCGKGIGMVFQNPDNQIIFGIVEDDLKFTLKNQRVQKEEWQTRINEALSLVHLEGFNKRETDSLSAGQKQRLVIANMLMVKPKVLIFDEVSVYLDQGAKKELFKLFKELKQNGITIVFATNLLGEIVYADRVLVLNNGKLSSFVSKEEVLKNLDIFKSLDMYVPLKLEILSKLKIYDLTSEEDILKILWEKLK